MEAARCLNAVGFLLWFIDVSVDGAGTHGYLCRGFVLDSLARQSKASKGLINPVYFFLYPCISPVRQGFRKGLRLIQH